MKRGEIWIADLGPPVGNEPGKQRPVLILQTDLVTQAGQQTVTVCPLTSEIKYDELMRITLPKGTANLDRDSSVMIDQIRTIDQFRFKRRIGQLDIVLMTQVNQLVIKFLDLELG